MAVHARSIVPGLVSMCAVLAASSCANVLGIEETSLEDDTPPEGRDWRCVGSVEVPTQSKAIQIRALVTDFSLQPFEGLTVLACAVAANPNCDSPTATAQSGPDGIATP
ncbi:MAG: hypothetical protein ACOC1F_00945, partial [Myxococcota bacterium]